MKRIVVQCGQGYTRVALMADGKPVEYYAEPVSDKQSVGNIYMGKVVNVLPGMQAAFVDIGQGKNAFLYVDDLLPAHLEKQPPVKPSIADLVAPGQAIMVQVAKEPIGTKGARVTTHFSLPGRWLVYMPEADYIGISRKIESEAERSRLKEIAERLVQNGEGLIVRTVANEENEEALSNDLARLRAVWNKIVAKADSAKAPSELYRELDIVPRLIRDIFNEEVDELVVDDPVVGEEVASFVRGWSEELSGRIRVESPRNPLFQAYGIEEDLDKLFRQKIWLASGGYLIVDHTEALTVIDVNTGKYTGSVDLEETVYHTNMEAADMIARLLRLRDLGGIIIVDFIDMAMDEHRTDIVNRLERHFREDRTKTLVVGWTKLGLLEITRKKIREHSAGVYRACTHCNGTGRVVQRMQRDATAK